MSQRNTSFINHGNSLPVPYLNDAKPPFQEKPHCSEWFITLNSNKMHTQELTKTEIAEDLASILINTFSVRNLPRFLFIKEDRNFIITESLLQDKTLFPDFPETNYNSKVEYVTETGTKKHRIHLHAIFTILHYTLLQIDINELHNVVEEQVENIGSSRSFDSVYLNVKWKPSAFPIKNYMRKAFKPQKLTKADTIDINSEYEEAVSQLSNINLF